MKYKRLLSLTMALAMICGSAAALPEGAFDEFTSVSASAEVEGDYEYRMLDDGTAEITKYKGAGGDVTIPSTLGGKTISSIGKNAFSECQSITSAVIPDGVKSIGEAAFSLCVNLTDVSIPSSVTSIGYAGFANCSSMIGISIPKSVTSISNAAFCQCEKLENFEFPEGVTCIKDGVLAECGNLKSVTIPKGVTEIEDMAFILCENLEQIEIPDGVVSIGRAAFSDCKNIPSINIPNSTKSIGEYAFDGCFEMKNLTIGNSVETIGQFAFRGSGITSVTLPESITSIGSAWFQDCGFLKIINIPKSVIEIDQTALLNCQSLTEINIDSENPKFCSENGVLYNKDKTKLIRCLQYINNVIIPEGVTTIGDDAFYYGMHRSVTIPSTVTSIGLRAFNDCQFLTEINITEDNTCFCSYDGMIFNKDKTELICCPSRYREDVTIPESVTSIRDYAFYQCRAIKRIVIPNSVNKIGCYAFNFCTDATELIIPDSVTEIGEYAFSALCRLPSVTIPGSIKNISCGAFGSCDNLETVTIENGVISIEDFAFTCQNLKNLTMPNTIKSIGAYAFCGAVITSIDLPDGIEKIGEFAFAYCTKVTSLTVPESVVSLGYGCFLCSDKLTYVEIPKSISELSDYAFGYYDESKNSSISAMNSADTIAESKTNGLSDDGTADMSSVKKVDDFKIGCYMGSAGEKYAIKNGFAYELLDAPNIERLAGTNRFSTAAAISKASYPDGADTVILAFGLNYADALAGVPLAEKLNAPILLTHTKTLPDETLAEIKRLGAKEVIILGGEGAINKDVEKTLKKNGLKTKRIAGQSRFGTATAIAAEQNKAPEELFFVYGLNSADALSVGGVAAAKGAPIIYLTTDGKLNADTEAYLKTVKGKVKNAYVIGGDGVISNAMMKNVADALGLSVNKTLDRVAGKNRYETCVAVNNKFKSVVSSDGICVAKGLDFPDALAGGVYAAKTKQALFLADGKKLQDVQSSYLKGKNASKITVFGGTGAVPDELVKLIAQACV